MQRVVDNFQHARAAVSGQTNRTSHLVFYRIIHERDLSKGSCELHMLKLERAGDKGGAIHTFAKSLLDITEHERNTLRGNNWNYTAMVEMEVICKAP